MEKAKKNLRDSSLLVLFFVVLSAIRKIVDAVVNGFEVKEVPEGMTEDVVRIIMVAGFVLSFVVLLPQIYVGIKGLKIAKEPSAAKGHIVWAVILLAFAVIAVFSPISSILKADHIGANVLELINCALDIAVYVLFLIPALEIRKGV